MCRHCSSHLLYELPAFRNQVRVGVAVMLKQVYQVGGIGINVKWVNPRLQSHIESLSQGSEFSKDGVYMSFFIGPGFVFTAPSVLSLNLPAVGGFPFYKDRVFVLVIFVMIFDKELELIGMVVIPLEPDGPEALGDDNMPGEVTVVILSFGIVPESMPVFYGKHVFVELLVATGMASRIDVKANPVEVQGGKELVVEHEPNKGFYFVRATQFPDPAKVLFLRAYASFGVARVDKLVGTCSGELPIHGKVPDGFIIYHALGIYMDGLNVDLDFFRKVKGYIIKVPDAILDHILYQHFLFSLA
ncbi:hypothetical protein KY290_036578 [Solanum tuberosum]|uniref:Uncharacterized protein n=1 Tax=Solanum tuberosum TaxID=4113 RepID=A0ABQ7TUL7_SOLTU|nr:hypothetical protein KY289_036069 [Solanum tuberosum]KAH0639314.1 hypothetical protein KY285_035900 [Solanum tuberosum]KAH0737873.1 hypothetical protein KY290_036578 [Solanum tuberosum]